MTRRARGFSLLEVIIASSILSVVLALMLSEMSGAVAVAKQGTADADLRRIAQNALEQISMDLRSTTAGNGSSLTVATSSVSFFRLAGYNTTTGAPSFEASPTVYSWTAPSGSASSTTLTGKNNKITASAGYDVVRGCDTGRNDAGTIDSTHDGITFSANPAGGANVATAITVTLRLRRQVGLRGDGSAWYVRVQVSTTVLVRAG